MQKCQILMHSFLLFAMVNIVRVNAGPVPALDLPKLTGESDIIIVGSIKRVWEEKRTTTEGQWGPVVTQFMATTLSLDRVIKGRATISDLTFKFLIISGKMYAQINVNQYGMFFLRDVFNQGYEVVDPYYPCIVAAPDSPGFKGNDLDNVSNEVAYVLTSSRTSNIERRQAITILGGVNTSHITNILRRTAENPDPSLQILACTVLLRRGDITTLPLVESILLHPIAAYETNMRNALAAALEGVRNPESIALLSNLVSKGDVRVRRGAAAALSRMEMNEVVTPLKYALRDSDLQVRYYAIIGLASITRQGEWGPMFTIYIKNEEKYLKHWREWADHN